MTEETKAATLLRFVLNGQVVRVEGVDWVAPLAVTIRDRLGLKGTKIACGQGNCGACTVVVQYPPDGDENCTAIAVDSCLFPTGNLLVPNSSGLVSVTTVEGACEADPASAKFLAENNATQCGFCTPGMVVKATWHAMQKEENNGTATEVPDIEDLLDGNVCRCTGYRPILYALKRRFAEHAKVGGGDVPSVSVPVDDRLKKEALETPPCVVRGEGGSYGDYKCSYGSGRLTHKNVFFPVGGGAASGQKVSSASAYHATGTTTRPHCPDPSTDLSSLGTMTVQPKAAAEGEGPSPDVIALTTTTANGGTWYAPSTLDGAMRLIGKHSGAVRLVMGNADSWRTPLAYRDSAVVVSLNGVRELGGPVTFQGGDNGAGKISIPARTTIGEFLLFLDGLDGDKYAVDSLAKHVKSIANIQVRNFGTLAGNLVAAHKDGLPSDVTLVLASLQGSVWIKVPSSDEEEIEVPVEDFILRKDKLPGALLSSSGNWVCTRLTAALPQLRNRDEVRMARLSPRSNFPPICSASCASYGGDKKVVVRAIGVGSPLRVFQLTECSSAMSHLQGLATQVSSAGVSGESERILLHMSARVLGVDGAEGTTMAVPMSVQRRDQGQRGEHRFFVDPAQAPVTEPIVKDAAYEHVTGKAMYPIDEKPPVGSLNGSPVTMPTAVAEFDPWLLKEAAVNLLRPLDDKVRILTAADLPYTDRDVVVDNIYSKNDTPEKIYSRMFTYRNVIVDDSSFGGKEGAVPHGSLGPGAFGEFVVAPGFTTYAGQVVALVLHPDESTSRKLAFRLQQVLENFFKPGEATWGVNKLNPDPKIKNLTPSHAIRNIAESKANRKQIVGEAYPTVHAHGTKSMFDARPDPQQARARYEDMWTNYKEDPNITFVENSEPVVAGRQTHMYMETQNATVSREEDRYYVTSSTQSPRNVQEALSHMLEVAPRDVVVSFHRIGGGFGGKAYHSINPALLAAFSCLVTGCPTRVAFERQADFDICGKRHQYQGKYRVAVDQKTKKIIAMDLIYDGDAGCSSASTLWVLQRGAITSSCMYRIPEFRCVANSWLTHKQSGTAFRSFGVIQAMTITETAVDHAHAQLQADLGVLVDAPSWRRENFYSKVDTLPDDANPDQWTDSSKYPVPPYYPRMPRNLSYEKTASGYKPVAFDGYGQELLETDNMCDPSRGAWAQATVHNPHFREAEKDCELFNGKNKFRKRAVAVTPLLYGSGYESWPMMQAAASIAISWAPSSWAPASRPDGPPSKKKDEWQYARLGYVLVNQGGCEMGQGVHVAVVQGCAAALNVPLGMVRVGKVNTDGTPNIISTEASTGSDINVPAAVEAAKSLRYSLEKMEDGLIYVEAIKRDLPVDEIWDRNKEMFISSKCHPRSPHHQWYRLQKSFENEPYHAGPRSETEHINHYIKYFRSWHVPVGERSETLPSFFIWEQVVNLAYLKRVPLFAGAIDGPHADGGRPSDLENKFAYQTYACAWSQVEVDGVTGEIDVLRTDIFYDAGIPRNPAVDIGQVEGAFVQGLGNITTEECEYDFDTGLKDNGLIKGRVKPREYETGRLMQAMIMKYAVPEHRTVPRILATHLTWIHQKESEGKEGTPTSGVLSKFEQAQPPPGDLTDYRRAKTTGEPPLVLAISVLSATREAVRLLKKSLLNESVTFVQMSTPLTPRHVLNVIWGEKNISNMTTSMEI